MYIFLSHCVRDGDCPKLFAKKKDLIDCLEKKGYFVFDYAERPGAELNWVNEIRLQLQACHAVIYFGKNWPEDQPGVCALECKRPPAPVVGRSARG